MASGAPPNSVDSPQIRNRTRFLDRTAGGARDPLHQHPDLFRIPCEPFTVATDDAVRAAAAAGAVFVFNLSGGKDSGALSHAGMAWLDSVGHPRSRRHAIHADLGRAEWRSTPDTVAATAAHLGLPLIVVRRGAGDLVARWEKRFANAKARYADLATYNLIGPWSQANKRFCTSELKAQVIGPEMARRFRGQTVVQVLGLRRTESANRAATAVSQPDTRFAKLGNRHGTAMRLWHPGVDWTTDEVFACHAQHGIPLHEAYTVYGSSRLSCAFCVLGSAPDLAAAADAAGNRPLFRHLVDLEATSTFSFQPNRWLADVAPQQLPAGLAADIARAKRDAAERRAVEGAMPPGLRYFKGWPPRMPTHDEAAAIVAARRPILGRHGLPNLFPTAASVSARFERLLAAKAARGAAHAVSGP
ncbi:phosphoadenosine phosphosulfate reductase family protein [uncultured Methylobacterium sp.]|uniref:phosphoadenosine phosphosulfate reductase domain-containing protein n=1 Tax=uncultured Methylobacterium sp. TaxID=157278 RepID=UPI0035CAB4A5